MHRLRERWVALLGGALLVTLSVSTAFGADPADETDGPRGQTIAGFVHSLIFTEDEPTDDETVVEEEELEEEDELDNEVIEGEPGGELIEGEVASGAEHGACVAEVARSDEVGGTNENHGGAVSEAARVTCWETEEADDELTPEEVGDEESLETDTHGDCVSEAAQDKEASAESGEKNHGAWVSMHARYICWGLEPPTEEADEADAADAAEGDTEEVSAKAERKAEKAAQKAAARADKLAAKAEKAAARADHKAAKNKP